MSTNTGPRRQAPGSIRPSARALERRIAALRPHVRKVLEGLAALAESDRKAFIEANPFESRPVLYAADRLLFTPGAGLDTSPLAGDIRAALEAEPEGPRADALRELEGMREEIWAALAHYLAPTMRAACERFLEHRPDLRELHETGSSPGWRTLQGIAWEAAQAAARSNEYSWDASLKSRVAGRITLALRDWAQSPDSRPDSVTSVPPSRQWAYLPRGAVLWERGSDGELRRVDAEKGAPCRLVGGQWERLVGRDWKPVPGLRELAPVPAVWRTDEPGDGEGEGFEAAPEFGPDELSETLTGALWPDETAADVDRLRAALAGIRDERIRAALSCALSHELDFRDRSAERGRVAAIALELGCSRDTVNERLKRGLDLLRAALGVGRE